MITVDNTSGNGRFLGLTLRGCERKLFLRASSIVTLCEAFDTEAGPRHRQIFSHTFVTISSMPDDNFEVTERAQEILERL